VALQEWLASLAGMAHTAISACSEARFRAGKNGRATDEKYPPNRAFLALPNQPVRALKNR
jgi:ubiquitin